MRKTVLTTVALVLVAALPATSPGTGIPVLDLSNLVQNTTTALKQVQAYAQMVQSYQLQLQQYANMVKNTVAPVAQVWQTAQGTMNGVLGDCEYVSERQPTTRVSQPISKRQLLALGSPKLVYVSDGRFRRAKAGE